MAEQMLQLQVELFFKFIVYWIIKYIYQDQL